MDVIWFLDMLRIFNLSMPSIAGEYVDRLSDIPTWLPSNLRQFPSSRPRGRNQNQLLVDFR